VQKQHGGHGRLACGDEGQFRAAGEAEPLGGGQAHVRTFGSSVLAISLQREKFTGRAVSASEAAAALTEANAYGAM
jgi:hypothetical protein